MLEEALAMVEASGEQPGLEQDKRALEETLQVHAPPGSPPYPILISYDVFINWF